MPVSDKFPNFKHISCVVQIQCENLTLVTDKLQSQETLLRFHVFEQVVVRYCYPVSTSMGAILWNIENISSSYNPSETFSPNENICIASSYGEHLNYITVCLHVAKLLVDFFSSSSPFCKVVFILNNVYILSLV